MRARHVGRPEARRASARPTQAANLKEAYHCLAGYPYVEAALWFTLQGHPPRNGDELNHYGLLRADGSHKPSWDAFHVGRRAAATSSPGRAATSTRRR